MAANTQRIEVTLETLLESVDLAESITMRIAEAAGFPDEEIHKIGMAVREGVINAYNYGNQQDRQKKILMTVELAPDNMTVKVIDQGQGFELTEIPDPLAEENLLRTSGRGLFLMRAFMDEFKVERGPEGGAQLVMIKKLPHVHSANGGQKKIALNLADVDYIDSSGIGELVSGFTTVRSAGGELKLLHLTKRVHDILQITRLFTVFDVQSDEANAVRSFK